MPRRTYLHHVQTTALQSIDDIPCTFHDFSPGVLLLTVRQPDTTEEKRTKDGRLHD